MKSIRHAHSAALFPLLIALLATSAPGRAHAALRTPVTIEEGGKKFLGELFTPAKPARSPLPLVVVVHEWWGKNDYSAMRAAKIADELGYAALAVDLYGNGQSVETPKEAGALSAPFYENPSLGVKRLESFITAAPAAAKAASLQLDLNKLVAIGYCFGGTQVLNLARSSPQPGGAKLLGVASFHGGLASSLHAQAPLAPRLLVLHGAADKMVKAQEVEAFKAEMKLAQANLDFKAYPGALHAFTNPAATAIGKKYGIPVAYDKKADLDSWKKLKAFLAKLF